MRGLLALLALVLVVLAAGVAAVASRPSGSPPPKLASLFVGSLFSPGHHARWIPARFGSGLSLRYPATWTRVDWCKEGLHFFPIALLTSAHDAPSCDRKTLDVTWPPTAHLARNGVAVALGAIAPPGMVLSKPRSNARIGGRRAFLRKPVYGSEYDGALTCPTGVRREFRDASIFHPYGSGEFIEVAAVICGPHLAAGEATVRHLLGTVRFADAASATRP
jgi:hypothetical protein